MTAVPCPMPGLWSSRERGGHVLVSKIILNPGVRIVGFRIKPETEIHHLELQPGFGTRQHHLYMSFACVLQTFRRFIL